MDAVLGIDVGKRECHAMLLMGERHVRTRFDNRPEGFTKLAAFLRARTDGAVATCMEATGTYHVRLATHLYELGHRVAIGNPAAIKTLRRQPALAHEDRPGRCRTHRAIRATYGDAAMGAAACRTA